MNEVNSVSKFQIFESRQFLYTFVDSDTHTYIVYLPNVTPGDDVYEHDESNSLYWSQLRHRNNIDGNLLYFVLCEKYM